MIDYGGDFELREHVARYLLRAVVSTLPPGVLKTLNEMSEEELAVLDRVGTSFREADAAPFMYPCGVH
jgi:hypothetical protein